MPILVDTNIFLRLLNKADPQRSSVLDAFRTLRSRGEILCFTPQIFAEFWNVSTRPASARGGFGLTVENAERKAAVIEKYFRLLPDTPANFCEWRRLVSDHKVSGVAMHDAKIVASMVVSGVTQIVTFNVRDFVRYAMIEAVDPRDI